MPGEFNREVQQVKIRIRYIALPPNQTLQLTCLPVTPLAKRRARGAPGSHAAELGRWADKG